MICKGCSTCLLPAVRNEYDNGHDDPESEDEDGGADLDGPPHLGAGGQLVQGLAHAAGDVNQADGLEDHEEEVAHVCGVDPAGVELAQVGDGNDESGDDHGRHCQHLEEPEPVVDVGADALYRRTVGQFGIWRACLTVTRKQLIASVHSCTWFKWQGYDVKKMQTKAMT